MQASFVQRPRLPLKARPLRVAQRVVRAEKEDIYLGQGRYVNDDPSKYPSKDSFGTGGWAGGEAGLKKWLEENEGMEVSGSGTREEGPNTKLLDGKDVIYTGKGNYVRDDAQKYPSKTSMTGGFAGGERGVEQYVSDGEVQFDENNRPQSSPLIVGLAISGVAVAVSAVWFVVSG